ncbi:LysR substrate-binding domain-containing protein [Luteimonas abyssi]|uniref:LysR substrate-binding domain-containing protein n=1 Tax=Luteimonas abyssi TaxID=1247514 RepID=UPI000737B0E2|nr:LysR substrate-binding domain-containing protein [Luteimonas abyssi]
MTLRTDWLPALAAFETAARHQNFAHAAEELHLTASAVSHHVRKLEARLGVTLFQRHARGVSLTAEGRRLADSASHAIGDLDNVMRELRAGHDTQRTVTVTTLHSFVHGWLLQRLPDFTAAFPDIRLRIDTGFALTRFDDEGGPDFGIRFGPGHWPGLAAHLLMEERLFAAAAPRYAGLDTIREAADIPQHPLIADLSNFGWHDWFRANGIQAPSGEARLVFSDSTDMLEAAAQGLGIALAREHVAAPWMQAGRLRALPGEWIQGRRAYYLVQPGHRRLRPAARCLYDWLVAQAGR